MPSSIIFEEDFIDINTKAIHITLFN